MRVERAGGKLRLGLRFSRSMDDDDSKGDELMCLFCTVFVLYLDPKIMRSSSLNMISCPVYHYAYYARINHSHPIIYLHSTFDSITLSTWVFMYHPINSFIINQKVPQAVPSITLHIDIIHTTPQSRLDGIRIPPKQPHDASPAQRCEDGPCIVGYSG